MQMMKHTFILVLALHSIAPALQGQHEGSPANPVTVVELFTSEGCSSCPAADELLEEMVGIMQQEGRTVIGLAFHVTYWDHGGWKDNYGSEEFTDRQQEYMKTLGIPQLYTPQAIANGTVEFIGSNPLGFREAVASVEITKPVNPIHATASQSENRIRVSYTYGKESKNKVLNIAIVETHAEQKITRGENKNRTLKHYNVVRRFQSGDLNKSGTVEIIVDETITPENAEVVLYVQDKRTMKSPRLRQSGLGIALTEKNNKMETSYLNSGEKTNRLSLSAILMTGLIAGMLDGLAAVVQTFIIANRGPGVVFRYVASGVFGTEAFQGGTPMAIAGFIFHMTIATGWASLFYSLAIRFRSLLGHKILSSILYGIFVWCCMNLVVTPLSNVPQRALTVKGVLTSTTIIIVFIGFPIVYFTDYFLRNRSRKR
jgi:hypothetical protein